MTGSGFRYVRDRPLLVLLTVVPGLELDRQHLRQGRRAIVGFSFDSLEAQIAADHRQRAAVGHPVAQGHEAIRLRRACRKVAAGMRRVFEPISLKTTAL